MTCDMSSVDVSRRDSDAVVALMPKGEAGAKEGISFHAIHGACGEVRRK